MPKKKKKSSRKKLLQGVLSIEKKQIERWTLEETSMWLTCLNFTGAEELGYISYFEENDIRGKNLCLFALESYWKLSNIFSNTTTFKEVRKLFFSLKHILRLRVYDRKSFTILDKVLKLGRAFEERTYDDLSDIIDILADKDKFYEHYFSFFVDFFKFKDNYMKLRKLKHSKRTKKVVKDIEKLKQDENLLRDKMKSTYENMTGNSFSEFIESRFYTSVKSKSWKIACKLIVTDIYNESELAKRNLRAFISPLVSKLPKFRSMFGIFHTALILGPWYLEWTNSSLTIPKKSFRSDKAIISHDLPFLSPVDFANFKEISMKLVDVLYLWNTEYYYANVRESKRGNCQDIIDDIFTSLDLPKQLLMKGVLGNFLRKLRNKGSTVLEFDPTDEFKKRAKKISWKKPYVFITHKDVDEFVIRIFSAVPEIEFENTNEIYLLKSFDRAFWLRFLKSGNIFKENSRYQPLKGMGGKLLCPFGSPLETQSNNLYC